MRQRFCRVCSGWHDTDAPWPHNCRSEVRGAPSDTIPVPMYISDTLEDVEHPCDGRRYSSKSAFRRTTKAHGCIEVGNDPARFRTREKPTIDKQSVKDSIQKAAARVKRGERASTA